MLFQGRLKLVYYSNSIWCHWSYYKLLSPSANSSSGRGLLKSMCDGQKRHKRKRIGFILCFCACKQVPSIDGPSRISSAVKNISVKDQQLHRVAWHIPGRESVPTDSRQFSFSLYVFPSRRTVSRRWRKNKIKLKQKKRHEDDDEDVHPEMRSKYFLQW